MFSDNDSSSVANDLCVCVRGVCLLGIVDVVVVVVAVRVVRLCSHLFDGVPLAKSIYYYYYFIVSSFRKPFCFVCLLVAVIEHRASLVCRPITSERFLLSMCGWRERTQIIDAPSMKWSENTLFAAVEAIERNA